jgi:hypothetical protein
MVVLVKIHFGGACCPHLWGRRIPKRSNWKWWYTQESLLCMNWKSCNAFDNGTCIYIFVLLRLGSCQPPSCGALLGHRSRRHVTSCCFVCFHVFTMVWTFWSLEMRPLCCPRTSGAKYLSHPRTYSSLWWCSFVVVHIYLLHPACPSMTYFPFLLVHTLYWILLTIFGRCMYKFLWFT